MKCKKSFSGRKENFTQLSSVWNVGGKVRTHTHMALLAMQGIQRPHYIKLNLPWEWKKSMGMSLHWEMSKGFDEWMYQALSISQERLCKCLFWFKFPFSAYLYQKDTWPLFTFCPAVSIWKFHIAEKGKFKWQNNQSLISSFSIWQMWNAVSEWLLNVNQFKPKVADAAYLQHNKRLI